MKKCISKIISFLEDPWVNLTVGIVGLLFIPVVFFDYSGFDRLSAFIGFLNFLFIDISSYGFASLIKKKRNSPRSGEDK